MRRAVRVRAAGVAGAVLALAAPVPAGAAQADGPEASGPSACAPVHLEGASRLDLQWLAQALCRAVWGDAEPGVVSERLRLRIGGWTDASYRQTDVQPGEYSAEPDHVNLHLDARWDDRWQLFTEAEYEHDPDVTGVFRDERELELEQLWGEYAPHDLLRVRAGRFATPFGYWTPLHWSILVDTIEDPLHETNRSIPEQQIGGGLFGTWFHAVSSQVEGALEYALYLGYAADGFDAGKPDGLTAGGDLRWRLADRNLLGVSLYTQRNGDEDDRREHDVMVYGQVQLPFRLLARAEYLWQHRSGRTREIFVRDADLVYAKLRWDFRPDAYLNYRFEYGEDDRFGATLDHFVNRVTAVYRPVPRVVLKAEYARHELSGRVPGDYHFWGLSAGVFF